VKILHTCESYWPEVCGVQEAVQCISEGLVARGHEVTVATSYSAGRTSDVHNGVRIEQFDVRGRSLRGYRGDVRAYQKFIRSSGCDLMLNYAAQQWSADLVFPLLHQLRCAKVFLPCGFSAIHNWKWRPYFWVMPRVLRRYDAVVYLSEGYQDKAFGDRHGIRHYQVIGNGAREEEFSTPRGGFRDKYGIAADRLFLSVSNYGELKNQRLVLEAFRRAGLPGTTLVFIGSEMNQYAGLLAGEAEAMGNVRVLAGIPRGDLVAAYHDADLFLFGSRTECFPLVIVEAMASGTPFISTDAGCVSDLPGGVVVAGVGEMTETIRRLSLDEEARLDLARSGRAAWEARYTWARIVNQYERLYERLVRESKGSS
jgi:glycosyltransferase involved in cell wall biosynthesis